VALAAAQAAQLALLFTSELGAQWGLREALDGRHLATTTAAFHCAQRLLNGAYRGLLVQTQRADEVGHAATWA